MYCIINIVVYNQYKYIICITLYSLLRPWQIYTEHIIAAIQKKINFCFTFNLLFYRERDIILYTSIIQLLVQVYVHVYILYTASYPRATYY